jgi:hypothetical protein
VISSSQWLMLPFITLCDNQTHEKVTTSERSDKFE